LQWQRDRRKCAGASSPHASAIVENAEIAANNQEKEEEMEEEEEKGSEDPEQRLAAGS